MSDLDIALREQIKKFTDPKYTSPLVEENDEVDATEIKEEMASLTVLLKLANEKYYDTGKSILTDSEYDKLADILKALEQEYPQYKHKEDSVSDVIEMPAQHSSLSKMPKYQHDVMMQSLNKVHNLKDLLAWIARIQKKIDQPFNLGIQDKLDGVAVKLIYRNGKLKHCVLRGNGREGFDLSDLVRDLHHNGEHIEGFPYALKFHPSQVPWYTAPYTESPDYLEVIGEFVVLKKKFDELNELLIRNKQKPYPTQRHAAAGLISARSLRSLNFVLYGYNACWNHNEDGEESPLFTHDTELFDWLRECFGFTVLPTIEKVVSIDDTKYYAIAEVVYHAEKLRKEQNIAEWASDGLVFKIMDVEWRDYFGRGKKAPFWAMAYKFQPVAATSELIGIEWHIGRTGVLTPIAKFNPVEISGVWYSKASLISPAQMRALDIHFGDQITIQRSGDVIPYIAGIVTETRKPDSEMASIPDRCDYCGKKVEETSSGKLVCTNPNCVGRKIEAVFYAISKDVLDLKKLRSIGKNTIAESLRKMDAHLEYPDNAPFNFLSRFRDTEKPEKLNADVWHAVLDEIEEMFKRRLTPQLVLEAVSIPGLSRAGIISILANYAIVRKNDRYQLELKPGMTDLSNKVIFKKLEDWLATGQSNVLHYVIS